MATAHKFRYLLDLQQLQQLHWGFMRFACHLRHLLGCVVLDVLLLVVVRGDFNQPCALDLDALSHVFFGSEHKLVIDDPSRLRHDLKH